MIPAFILGNGPFLPLESLHLVANRFTIGVNRILRIAFAPTILMWVDASVYQDDGAEIEASNSLLICSDEVAVTQKHVRLPLAPHGTLKSIHHLEVCGNTGACAARWAVALGCWPVYILGMGGQYRHGRSNCYGMNRRHTDETLKRMQGELDLLLHDHPDHVRFLKDGGELRQAAQVLPELHQPSLRAMLQTILGVE